MSDRREFTSTSISIPSILLRQARAKAAATYRNFSQYVSYLIDQDLNHDKPKRSFGSGRERFNLTSSGSDDLR